MKTISEEQQNSVSSGAKFPAVYQEDIDQWLKRGNSLYNLRLLSGGDSEFLVGWNETSILVLQSDHQQIRNKWTFDGGKDYELNLHCDSRHCILSMTWLEQKTVRNFGLSIGGGDASELLPVINLLLNKVPYQADIIRDDETADALLQNLRLHEEYGEFVHCFCDSVLDSYLDRKKKFFQNGPVVDYFFGVSMDGIVVSAFQGKTDAQFFYFPWKTISDISCRGRKIKIKTISENSYSVPVSFRKRKEAKRISDSYSYLTRLF